MNLGPSAALQLAKSLKMKLTDIRNAGIGVCPPSISIPTVVDILKGSRILIGAQNVYYGTQGAFTGEISASMIKESGCTYVIIGHSERRHLFGETDEAVNKKLAESLRAGLTPVVCVGETLEERESNQTESVIHRQFHGALAGYTADQLHNLIIAYEPVWAIGTGRNATPGQANEVHELIRGWAGALYGTGFANTLTIQYGGSVKPDNAEELLSKSAIDGALVGGASLDADSFASIVRKADQLC